MSLARAALDALGPLMQPNSRDISAWLTLVFSPYRGRWQHTYI